MKFDDKKYIKREFELGDIVLVRKSIRNKDDYRFEGPVEIIDKVHDRSYTIRFENGRTLVKILNGWNLLKTIQINQNCYCYKNILLFNQIF